MPITDTTEKRFEMDIAELLLSPTCLARPARQRGENWRDSA